MLSVYKNHGFTIVELLTVIVVIAILASFTVVAYNGIRTRAQAASVSDGLKKVEKSFILWSIENGYSTWPYDPVTGGGTSLIDMISADPSLRNYLQNPPVVTGVHSEEWFYDNEGDEKTNCSDPYAGVNIVLRYVDSVELAQQVDQTIDDGNLSCGKVRYVDRRLFYTISNTQPINQ